MDALPAAMIGMFNSGVGEQVAQPLYTTGSGVGRTPLAQAVHCFYNMLACCLQ